MERARLASAQRKRDYMILVTGGAGFIGANFVLDWLRASDEAVLNVD
ncbi:dTDP-glucose 4,6-dehydratase, partial [Burkholderia multivorans]